MLNVPFIEESSPKDRHLRYKQNEQMKSQPASSNRRRRYRLYNELTQFLAKLTPPSPVSYSQENLQSLRIQCSAMTLLPEEEPNTRPPVLRTRGAENNG